MILDPYRPPQPPPRRPHPAPVQDALAAAVATLVAAGLAWFTWHLADDVRGWGWQVAGKLLAVVLAVNAYLATLVLVLLGLGQGR